jgi:cytochrome c oxidase subunit II
MLLRVKHGLVLLIAALSIFSAHAFAAYDLNMTPGVTKVSQEIYGLHMLIFYICVVIGIGVFGAMLWSIVFHRKSKGAKASHFHESISLEIAWTVVPFLILIFMAVPSLKTLEKVYDTKDAEMTVKITGYQWKWRYDYVDVNGTSDSGVGFFSVLRTSQDEIYNKAAKGENYLLEVDEPLVVPVGKKIRFVLTANDVIHAWWVPALAVKKDAIPGFINEASATIEKPGIYRGQCAELCGKDHGFMPIVVHAVSQADFDKWFAERQTKAAAEKELRNKQWTLAELMQKGEEVYGKNCAGCHQANGEGMPPTFPGLKGSKIAVGPVEGHIDIVMNGKPGTMMAAYGPQLSEVDLAAVITYERNAWGNNKGDMVTPVQIMELKAKK